MKSPIQKQLTFEQISKKYNMPISEVNSVINTAYNKMVHTLVVDQNFDIWDVVFEMKKYFNMTEKEAVDKLTNEHRELLKESAKLRTINQ
jgi:hypothetical protein